jgi:hypothetical protein
MKYLHRISAVINLLLGNTLSQKQSAIVKKQIRKEMDKK